MGKYLALILFIPLLFSCASRKVSVSKTQKEVHIDSSVVEKKDSTVVKQNAIVITDSSDEIEVTPIDTSKPVIIGEVKYYNAKIKVRKNRIKTVDSSKTSITTSASKEILFKKDVKEKTFDKKVEKKTNYLWLLLIPILGYLIYRYVLKRYF